MSEPIFLKHRNGLLIIGTVIENDHGTITLTHPYVYNTKQNDLVPLYRNLGSKTISIPGNAIDMIFHDSPIIERYKRGVLNKDTVKQEVVEYKVTDEMKKILDLIEHVLNLSKVVDDKWIEATKTIDILNNKMKQYQGKQLDICFVEDEEFFNLVRAFVNVKVEAKRVAQEKLKKQKEEMNG